MMSKHKTLFSLFKLEIILLATITSKNKVELPISSAQSGTYRDPPIWMFGANHIQDRGNSANYDTDQEVPLTQADGLFATCFCFRLQRSFAIVDDMIANLM